MSYMHILKSRVYQSVLNVLNSFLIKIRSNLAETITFII